MNQTRADRLYFLFALVLLALAWKISHAASASFQGIRAAQTAQLEKALAEN